MRGQFEFRFYTVPAPDAVLGEVDPTLAMLGTQGWEIRGLAALADDTLLVALQRPLEVESLPDAPSVAAKMAKTLTAPSPEELERG
jgi:hypothetical protein